MSAFINTLADIDNVIGEADTNTTASAPAAVMACHTCGKPLTESVSNDFCDEPCQTRWLASLAESSPHDGGQSPNEDQPEAAPLTPVASWLGAPPGVVSRPGHELLDAVTAFLNRFLRFPSEHCAPVVALWFAHTHLADRLYVTPRLILSSAEPGSGKTRVLEIGQYLVHKPEMTISMTTAAIFRLLLDGPVTLMFDEIDAVFSTRGGNNEDLRGLLNAGYKRSATIARCVGDAKSMNVQRFPVYAPVALAGIAGHMPATITSRAVTIHMRKAAYGDDPEEFLEEDVELEAAPLRAELAAWADTVADQVATARPERPDGVRNRAAEIWRPLLALAEAAGGDWPARTRAACTHFVIDSVTSQEESTGVQLLAALRELFTQQRTDRIRTADILGALHTLEEAQWADMGDGKALNPQGLARELKRYDVRPVVFEPLNPGEKVGRGYVAFTTNGAQAQTGLADAWRRYLPPAPSAQA